MFLRESSERSDIEELQATGKADWQSRADTN
jgi:hypothetical protein